MRALERLLKEAVLPVAAAALAIAVWERASNLVGWTLLRGYSPYALLEFAVAGFLLVIALELRELRRLGGRS